MAKIIDLFLETAKRGIDIRNQYRPDYWDEFKKQYEQDLKLLKELNREEDN